MKKSKFGSIFISLLFYVIATAVGVVTFNMLNLEMHWLLRLFIADVAATIVIFIGSLLMNNSSMYDPYWSIKPMVFAFAYMLYVGFADANIIQWIAFILMQLYGLRLTSNFYRDWVGFEHEDWRYVEFREQHGKLYWAVSFGGIHFFPTLMVYLSCLPLYPIFLGQPHASNANHIIVLIGAFILLGSIILAFMADEQMRAFRTNPLNKGKYMDQKLWKNSRHPNYLGEILTWWGLYIIALGLGFGFWWTGIGALAINLMFVGVSVPWLDKRSLAKRPGFDKYMDKTSMLLPIAKK